MGQHGHLRRRPVRPDLAAHSLLCPQGVRISSKECMHKHTDKAQEDAFLRLFHSIFYRVKLADVP